MKYSAAQRDTVNLVKADMAYLRRIGRTAAIRRMRALGSARRRVEDMLDMKKLEAELNYPE